MSSCSSSKQANLKKSICNENLDFKKVFFEKVQDVEIFITKQLQLKSIENIENYYTKDRIDSFENSLSFISKYSKVSYESMVNYNRSYPYGVYEEDKKNWLKWYDENKCSNIQLKNSDNADISPQR